MSDSVFTRIIKGEIPAHKIYEDDQVLAFLDISPYTLGHTLIVPKKEVDHLWDIDDPLYEHMMKVAKKIANRQRAVLKPPRVGIIVEGFAVPHAHVHVLPMAEGIEGTIAHRVAKPTDAELATMAQRLAFSDSP